MFAFRLQTSIAPRAAFASTGSRTIGRAFHSAGGALRVSKESELHRERTGEELEAEKERQLKDQKAGKGEWKASLSSDSEESVKADRHELNDSKEDIKTLQEKTAQRAEKEHKGQ